MADELPLVTTSDGEVFTLAFVSTAGPVSIDLARDELKVLLMEAGEMLVVTEDDEDREIVYDYGQEEHWSA
jgi:hypothetical protein